MRWLMGVAGWCVLARAPSGGAPRTSSHTTNTASKLVWQIIIPPAHYQKTKKNMRSHLTTMPSYYKNVMVVRATPVSHHRPTTS